eukprot:TRINITY_DN23670_c0_g1_i1.p1 TRINITY_DN23670_c0_g1~~TRINITY_DN23670_c0_g1_i1.p1  ORF type:complete len:102 (-),score=4.16 TRINITY_DN23670_c0_g1_i1:51-356(-)
MIMVRHKRYDPNTRRRCFALLFFGLVLCLLLVVPSSSLQCPRVRLVRRTPTQTYPLKILNRRFLCTESHNYKFSVAVYEQHRWFDLKHMAECWMKKNPVFS